MEKVKNIISDLKSVINRKNLILIFIIVSFSLVFQTINQSYLSLENFTNLLTQSSVMGILAVGLAFVLLTGGLDLSAGFNVSLSALIGGFVFTQTHNVYLSILTCIIIGIVLGFINGFIIVNLKLNSFIVTLATMSLYQGATSMMGEGRVMLVVHEVYTFIGKKIIGFIPVSAMIMICVFLFGSIILNNSTIGTYISALGSDEKNARASGIPIGRYRSLAYTILGLCAGIAAVVLIGRISLVTSNSAGNNLLLDSFACVIIGGAKPRGGSVKISGVFLGVLLMTIITNALTMLAITGVAHQMFKGLVIIVALVLNEYGEKMKIKKSFQGSPNQIKS